MADRRGWIPVAAVLACVACQCLIAMAPVESLEVTTLASRAGVITAIVGLALIAVGVSVIGSMGVGREGLGLRMIAAVPIVLSVALVVVLILEANFRARTGGG